MVSRLADEPGCVLNLEPKDDTIDPSQKAQPGASLSLIILPMKKPLASRGF